MDTQAMTIYEYGAMSSKFSCEAENKLTAYAVMCIHYNHGNHLVAIYSPEECKKDSWMNFGGKVSARLDEVFGGPDSFDKYLEEHKKEIEDCFKSIKRLV